MTEILQKCTSDTDWCKKSPSVIQPNIIQPFHKQGLSDRSPGSALKGTFPDDSPKLQNNADTPLKSAVGENCTRLLCPIPTSAL